MGHSVAGAATASLKVLAETEALDPVFVSFGIRRRHDLRTVCSDPSRPVKEHKDEHTVPG